MTGGVIQSIDYAAVAAPLVLVLVAGLVLVLDAFLPARPGGARLLGLVTLGGLLATLAVVAVQALSGETRRTFCVPASLTGPGRAAGVSCSFVADRFTLVVAAVVLAAGVVVALLSMTEIAAGSPAPSTTPSTTASTARDAAVAPQGDVRPGAAPGGPRTVIPAGEWYFLLLSTLAGAVLLPASRDLVMLVVSLELVSLPVFALTALRRHDGRASEAALKLFLVSVVSTAVTLFGVSLLYGVTGSVHLDRIDAALRATAPGGPQASVTAVAVVLVGAGFAFKVAAVPFHFWAGDVYRGAPIPVAALLSVVSKAAGFAGLILLLTAALPGRAAFWAPGVAVVAALTMTAGNVLAMRQRAAVRLLAWSSVAHSGYILAPLAAYAAVPRGAAGASVAYLVFYAAMNLIAFAVVMLVARRRGSDDLDVYRGMALRSPAAGLSLAFALVCLAGLPPGLAGLFAKIVVFRAIVDGGLGWLAVVMAVNTVAGLYYYIAWTARLFAPSGESRTGRVPVTAAGVAVTVTVAITLVFSVVPQLVLSMTG